MCMSRVINFVWPLHYIGSITLIKEDFLCKGVGLLLAQLMVIERSCTFSTIGTYVRC